MPAGILLWIISSSDRYLIIHFYGLSEAGIYTSSRSLGGLLWLLYYPIQFVLFPTISRLWEEQHFNGVKQYLEQSTKLFLIVAIPAVAGIAILSQPLLRILTTSQYLIGSTLVLCTATGALFMGIYSINVNIVYLRKQTKLLPLMIGGASVINILLNLILLPRVGLIGAAISNIVSFFVLAVVVSIWARKQVGYGMHPLLILKIIGATLIMSVCLYFIKAHSLLAVVLSGFVAIIVLVISLFLLKAFSEDDKKLIKNIISGFLPGIDK
jgi:O-antigen/teichoic acid export membrane protein